MDVPCPTHRTRFDAEDIVCLPAVEEAGNERNQPENDRKRAMQIHVIERLPR